MRRVGAATALACLIPFRSCTANLPVLLMEADMAPFELTARPRATFYVQL